MSLELKSLHQKIHGCQLCAELKTRVPLLFVPNANVKTIVVTQGPKGEVVDKERMHEVKKGVLSPANIYMYPFLYTIFSGRFRPDGDVDKEPSTAYWTHVRKCFMEGESHKILHRCSEAYLTKEIGLVKPKLIIAVGGHAAKFFAGYNDDLRRTLESGLEKAFSQQEGRFYGFRNTELGVDADVAVVPHPSGQNARLWRELGKDQKTAAKTAAVLESLRKKVNMALQDP